MKTDAAWGGGGVGRGGRRRGLLSFAVLLVIAQVVLFVFLRVHRDGDRVRDPSPVRAPEPLAGASSRHRSPAPAPKPIGSPAQAPQGARLVASARPGNQPLDGTGNDPAVAGEHAVSDPERGDDHADSSRLGKRDRDRRENERADRERERRDRVERDRDQARERTRLEAERDRAKLEAERDRVRLEAERAEKARIETERERAMLDADRAQLAEKDQVGSARPAVAIASPPPSPGNPDVLVVMVSSRAGGGNLGREQIRNIYFGKTTFWANNTPVRVYNRPSGSAAGRKFFRSVLGMSAGAFREHWNELQLSGGGIAPATVGSAESIVARIAGGPGAIGYALESELPADVSGVRLIRFK
jgi:hypothetical protein